MAEHKSHNVLKGLLSSSRSKKFKKNSESTPVESSRNDRQHLAVPATASRRWRDSTSRPESPVDDELSSYQASEASSVAPSDDEQPETEPDLNMVGGTFWEQAYQKLSTDPETKSLMQDYDAILSASQREAAGDDKIVDGAPIPAPGQSSMPDPVPPPAEAPTPNQAFTQFPSTAPGSAPAQAPKDGSHGGKDEQPHNVLGKEVEMQGLVTQKLKEMQDKEWVVKWKGKEVFRVRKAITETVKIIQKFSDLASKAADLDPLHAGLAWAGVSCVLPLIINDTEERTKAVDGVSSTSQITARYLFIERDYRKGRLQQDNGFEVSAIKLCSEILKFYAKAAVYFARRSWKKWLRNSFKIDDWTSALDAITVADQECQAFGAVLTSSTLLAGREEIAKLLAAHEKENIQKMVAWVSDTKVGLQHQKVKEKLGGQYAGSGQWLLESPDFLTWKDASHGYFWLRGSIGTGKSSLVSIVIEHLKDKTENFAFFYCTNTLSIPGANEAPKTTILRALAAQLVLSPDKTAVAEEVKLEHGKSVDLGVAGSGPGYEQSLQILSNLIASRDTTTIIIDALDECPNYLELLGALKILDKQNNLKLLLSSQLVVPVNSYLELHIKTIGLNDNMEDIRSFISGEMEKFNALRPGVLTEKLSDDILDILSNRAGCMFKWAELTLRFLLDPSDEEHQADIQEHLDDIKKRPNQGVLRQMAEAYEKLYKKHLPSDIEKRAKEMQKAEKILAWIFVSARPLHLYEIHCLADGRYNDNAELRELSDRDILKVCRNFIFVSEEQQIVEISHSSVSDFLALKLSGKVEALLKDFEGKLDSEKLLKEAYDCSRVSANTRVAQESISYLISTKKFVIDSLAELNVARSLLPYTAKFWFQHVRLVIRNSNEAVADDEQSELENMPDKFRALVRSLLSPENQKAFENWLDLHNIDQSQRKNKYIKRHMPGKSGKQLYYTMLLGFWAVARDMIDDGGDVEAVGGYFGTCLQLASYRGDEKTVSKILEKRPSVNTKAGIFCTALQAAAAGGHPRICSLLLDNGADTTIQGGLLNNAVQAALAQGSRKLVEVLTAGITLADPPCGELWKSAFVSLSRKEQEEFARLLGDRIADNLPRGLTFDQKLLASTVAIGHNALLPANEFMGFRESKKFAKERYRILDGQSEMSKRIAEHDKMEKSYLYHQLPWNGFHLIFQFFLERPLSDDESFTDLNWTLKVALKHEGLLVVMAQQSNHANAATLYFLQVLTSMYQLIFRLQISLLHNFSRGSRFSTLWRRLSGARRNRDLMLELRKLDDEATAMANLVLESSSTYRVLKVKNFQDRLKAAADSLERDTLVPEQIVLEQIMQSITNENQELIRGELRRRADNTLLGIQLVEEDTPEQNTILNLQHDTDVDDDDWHSATEGGDVGTGTSTEILSAPREAEEAHGDPASKREQELGAEIADMKIEVGLLRKEVVELKGLVNKLLSVLERKGEY